LALILWTNLFLLMFFTLLGLSGSILGCRRRSISAELQPRG